MKVIVTGGLGCIGSRYVDRLPKYANVTVVDNGMARRHAWTMDRLLRERAALEVVRFDVAHLDWSARVQGVDVIVHAAAHTGIPHSVECPNDDWHDNVDATRAILEGMRKAKSTAVLVALSSVKPYRPRVGIVDEECELEPDEPYAASKLAQAGLVQAYARSYGLRATVLRCSNLYGDAPCHGPRHGWLTWFCIAAAIGRAIDIQGTGMQSRDMLFCTDVTSAIESAIANIDTIKGGAYVIGGGDENEISVGEAVQYLMTRGAPTFTRSAGRPNEDTRVVADMARFHNLTGWWPKVGVREGMSRIYDWAMAHAEELRSVYQETTR